MICPFDLKPCCDDLCQTRCLKGDEAPMFPCPGCGKPVSDEDHDLCECDWVDYEDDR